MKEYHKNAHTCVFHSSVAASEKNENENKTNA